MKKFDPKSVSGIPSIETVQLDADITSEVVAAIYRFKPILVINTALPYQDLSIMNACLETGVDYLDTANYEPPDEAKFCYKWQWDYHERFKQRGIMALLGCGFDPGVTNVFCAHARENHFDSIEYIDIMDANGGDHGQPFATNFIQKSIFGKLPKKQNITKMVFGKEFLRYPPIRNLNFRILVKRKCI